MNRRRFLQTTSVASVTLPLVGCLGGSSAGTGTLATQVSDRPGDISDFESCVLTITEVRVKAADPEDTEPPESSATGADGGVEVIDAGGATADLVDLQGEKSTLVAEADLPTGDYRWLKLIVDGVDATLTEGGEADVTTPGAAPLKFATAFEIRSGTTTSFTADFTPVQKGRTGSYVFQPVAKEVTVSYSDGSTAKST